VCGVVVVRAGSCWVFSESLAVFNSMLSASCLPAQRPISFLRNVIVFIFILGYNLRYGDAELVFLFFFVVFFRYP